MRVRGWSNNEYTQARKRDVLRYHQLDLKEVDHCDFCGAPLSGVSYERLSDGRIRCNDCSSTAINNPEDFKEIFYRTLQFMQDFYDIKYLVPVTVKTTDAKTIAKGTGRIFKRDVSSDRTLGYAQRGFGKFTVLIENGSPRNATIETLSHEMTHIWQYTNWNDRQMLSIYNTGDRRKNDLLYLVLREGMAMWASIQYLYQIGETYYASMQEQEAVLRKDEYGVGFILYCNAYPLVKEPSPLLYTPFKQFPPIDPDEAKSLFK